MPKKKNKNQAKNAFYYYMVSLRPQLERQGVILANGMQSLAEIAGPRWKDLPEHEKEVYQEMARQAKANKQSYGGLHNGRKDCTGQLLSQRVDTVSLNENKRRRQREEVRSVWPPGKLVCDERFFFIGFMSLCQPTDEIQLPCELGVAEFSINSGIINTMHRFIHPGDIPLGYRFECMSSSEKTHKIPIEGLAAQDDTYRRIFWDLLRFVNPEQYPVFPPVYSRAAETKQTDACLDWLARNAEMPNRLKKVYELEGLICDLYHHVAPERQGISKSQASDLISTTVFDYEPGARCDWHEDQEVKYCALGTVKRYSFCMGDFLCPHYNVPLTVKHVPERPEGSFCTILNTQDSNAAVKSTNARIWNSDGDNDNENEINSYARPNKGFSYGNDIQSYHRTGPTYEIASVQPSSYMSSTSTLSLPDRPGYEQQLSASRFNYGTDIPSGRSRGRGRGVPSSQFVRQPNMDADSSFGRCNNQPGSVLNYASKGRGASRVPNTTPMVYAGSASAPHPSFAPPPPASWQQQHNKNYGKQQQSHQMQSQQNFQRQRQFFPPQNYANGVRSVSDVMNMMTHMNILEKE